VRRLVVAALFTVAGCGGGHPPTLSELTLSSAEVQRGREFFVTAEARDRDGDLSGGRVLVNLDPVADGASLRTEAPVPAAEGQERAEIAIGLTLLGAAPIGPYRLEMTLEDASGLTSDRAITNVRVTQ